MLTSSHNSPWWKTKGQKRLPNRASTQTNLPTGKASVVLHIPEGDMVECTIRLVFPTTNNKVEHETLIARLDLAKEARATNMVVYCDSQVVTS